MAFSLKSLDDALEFLGHAVESASGERQEPGGLLALADRVGRALTGRGVAQNEPVHVRIGKGLPTSVPCSAFGRPAHVARESALTLPSEKIIGAMA